RSEGSHGTREQRPLGLPATGLAPRGRSPRAVSRGAGTPAESTSRSFGAARPANARGELIRSCTVRSCRRRIRLGGRFPYRPTIGGARGIYRPSIGPVSAIERAIVCMRRAGEMPRFSGLASADFEGFLHTATSGAAPAFFVQRAHPRRRGRVPTTNILERRFPIGTGSLQLQHDRAFRDSWSGHTSFAGILVLVDRDREPSASGTHEGIAHETLYPPDETFHFCFVLLQEIEKRLRAFARIASNDSMHDTPPTADVLHVNAAGT